jgi:flagellar hook-associated protein 3 FlgL
MRISTSQYYETTSSNYSRTYGNVVKTGEEASSLVRINTAADDPLGAARLLQLSQQSSMLSQYSSNMTNAKTTLTSSETALTSVTDALQRARELALGASNATYTDADRKAVAEEITQLQAQVLGLMNTQDASGNYLFSGSKASTPPYSLNSDGSYSYNGDQTSVNLAIGQGLSIASNTTGWDAFEQAVNTTRTSTTPISPTVNDGVISLSGGMVTNSATYNSSFTSGQPYTVAFTSNTQLKITDASGNDVTSEATAKGVVTSSAADQTISFRGVDLTLNVNSSTTDLTGRSYSFGATGDSFTTSRSPGNTSAVQVSSAVTTDSTAYTKLFPAGGAVLKYNGTTSQFDMYASPVTADSKPVASAAVVSTTDTSTTPATVTNTATVAGVAFTLSGDATTLADGDQFSVSASTHSTQNILNTLTDLKNALLTPTDGSAVATQKLNAAMQSALGNLSSGMEQVSTAISSIGARGQAVDAQTTTNTTLTNANTTTQGTIRDSDPAEVMTRLTLQQTMLSAAQLAFSRISQLGLFNKL